MNLVFIKTPEEFKAFTQQTFFDEKHGWKRIPLMPKVALHMAEVGEKDIRLPVDFLSRGEKNAVFQEALDISRNWYQHIKKDFTFKNIDLMDTCRPALLGFIQDLIVSEQSILRMIDEYHPNEVCLMKQASVPSAYKSMHDGTADIFEAVAEWHFMKAGSKVGFIKDLTNIISFMNLSKDKTSDFSEIGRQRLSELSSCVRYLIGIGGGYDLLVIWPYLKSIADKTGYFPLLINISPRLDSKTLRSGIRLYEDMKYIYLGDIPTKGNNYPPLEDVKREFLNTFYVNENLPDYFRTPCLRFQFKYLFENLISGSCSVLGQADYFFSNYCTCLFLEDWCAGNINRTWTAVAAKHGITTINTPHSTGVNLVELFDFSSQFACASGELIKENLTIIRPEKTNEILITGDPSMESIRKEYSENTASSKNTILFITGGFLHQAWTDFELSRFLTTWDKIFQNVREMPQFNFVIKPHPSFRDLGYWYKQRVKEAGLSNIVVIDDKKIEDILPSTLLSVLVGKPGTSGIVSCIFDVPVVFLDTMMNRDVPGYRIWKDENGIPCFKETDDLFEMIKKIESDRLKAQEILLKNKTFKMLYIEKFNVDKIIKVLSAPSAVKRISCIFNQLKHWIKTKYYEGIINYINKNIMIPSSSYTRRKLIQYIPKLYKYQAADGYREYTLTKASTIENIKKMTLAYIARMRITGKGRFLGYRHSRSTTKPVLYATLAALLVKHLYKMTDPKLSEEIEYIQQFQRDDGIFCDPVISCREAETEDWWGWRHLTLHALMTLALYDRTAKKEIRWIKKYSNKDKFLEYLYSKDWNDSVDYTSNEIQNLGVMLQYARDFQNSSLASVLMEILFEVLNKKQNVTSGLYGPTPKNSTELSRSVQAAYHFWLLYFYDKQPINHMDKIVDNVLRSQNILGGYSVKWNSSACEDIDSIDPLTRFSSMTNYRQGDIKQSLLRALPAVLSNLNGDGGFVFRRHEHLTIGHPQMFSAQNESNMFYTWFRTLGMAYLLESLGDSAPEEMKYDWNWKRAPGHQFL